MELQQLRYFTQVAHFHNFTRAAQACRVAQPSLSLQIQKLEQQLGGPLFHRQGKRTVLTELGTVLLPQAIKILQLHEDTLNAANEHVGKGGMVRFGAILTIAPYLIPKLFQGDQAQPLPQCEVFEDFTENLLRKLKHGELDFAIMSTPVNEPGLLVKVIAQEPFVALLPKAHPLSRKRSLKLEDIYKHPFLPLSQIHCAGQQISELCQFSQAQMQTTFKSTQIETILRLVAQGAGITILPKMAVADLQRKDVITRTISHQPMSRDIALVHHQDRYLGKSTHTIIKRIQTTLKK